MKKFLPLLLLFTFFIQSAIAQKDATTLSASDQIHTQKMKDDPDYKQNYEAYRATLQEFLRKNPKGGRIAATLITIPIAVHVMNTGGAVGSPYNPSDAAINNMITFLNQGFKNTIASACGVDIEVQFALAQRKPDCSAYSGTAGIDRYNLGSDAILGTQYTAFGVKGSGITDTQMKGSFGGISNFDPSSYMNLWIVNKIDGTDGTGGGSYVSGYGAFPGGNAATDGMVMLANEVGTATINANTSRTLIHEVGHYLGLRHTFAADPTTGDPIFTCPPNTSCSTQGDNVCDTEPYFLPNTSGTIDFTCNGSSTNPCTIATFSANASGCTVLNNFMSYAYNPCLKMFTDGQKAIMRGTLNTARSGLVNSFALTPPTTAPPAACTVTAPNGTGTGNYFGLTNFTLSGVTTINNSSGYSKSDGNFYIDHACTQEAKVYLGQTYPISVDGGRNFSCHKVYVDWNNDGNFTGTNELVYSTSSAVQNISSGNITVPTGLSVPRRVRMRVISDPSGGNCANLTSCNLPGTDMNFGSGQAEDFTLDVQMNPLPVTLLSFTGEAQANRTVLLKWETAGEQNSDRFIVERSENLKTFEQVAQVKSGGNITENRNYSASDNNPIAGVNYYRLKEYAINGSPTIYTPIAVQVSSNGAGTIVYPNPSNGQFMIDVPEVLAEGSTFKLTNVLGMEISTAFEKVSAAQFKCIPTQKLAIGVYILSVRTDNSVRNIKILVQ